MVKRQNKMAKQNDQDTNISPFHAGEQELQARTGQRDMIESFGRKAMRSFMPDQHREFFTQLPFIVVGSVDKEGWPWASIVSGKPGFISSPDEKTLCINGKTNHGDPLVAVTTQAGNPIGLLGIDMMAQRRNRLNGRIIETGSAGFTIRVDQSFGNCPQYIQRRTAELIDRSVSETETLRQASDIVPFSSLDDEARMMISHADTFYVASFKRVTDKPAIEGVDVSHRGGRPGFVKIEGETLTVPDYSGNLFFNTLGNFLVNPKAGLIFVDFSTGDLLMLTGKVELLLEDEPEVKAFQGAERAWRFLLDHGIRLKNALSFRSAFLEYSPNTLITGTWTEANAILAAEVNRNNWRAFRVNRIEDESSVIRSFFFEPTDGAGLLPFKAGQFLTLRLTPVGCEQSVVRTYTISSCPTDSTYRISVKKEPDGLVSSHLHDHIRTGDLIEIKAPRGDFFIDAAEQRPAVLLAGGVGITPMISMAAHVLSEGLRTRYMRPLTIIHGAKSIAERAFAATFYDLQKRSSGALRYFSVISQPAKLKTSYKFGITTATEESGHITADVLQRLLPIDDYDFYLCGPARFMQALYDLLRKLGASDGRIFAEAFGPASLVRKPDQASLVADRSAEADEAVVRFSQAGIEQQWHAGDGTILETAEANGLAPAFSCRNGVCGTCSAKLLSGKVVYRKQPVAEYTDDDVLLCCAVPAKDSLTVKIEL